MFDSPFLSVIFGIGYAVILCTAAAVVVGVFDFGSNENLKGVFIIGNPGVDSAPGERMSLRKLAAPCRGETNRLERVLAARERVAVCMGDGAMVDVNARPADLVSMLNGERWCSRVNEGRLPSGMRLDDTVILVQYK